MEFPRLTSGGSGRLTFDVVNDMFERIEALEGKGIPRKLHKDYASDIFPAKITTENPAAPGQYQFTEQERTAANAYQSINGRRSSGYLLEAEYFTTQNIFTAAVGATSFFAWNGAENTTDSTSKGVGFLPSSNAAAIYTRQPIKNGIAVEIIRDKNGLAMFSIPNGYKVVC